MTEIISISLGFTTVYLLECDTGFLQIDTGTHSQYNQYLKKLENKGISVSDISYLLLTHHHYDHAGFASELQKLGTHLIVHKNAVPYFRTGEHEEGEYVNFCIKVIGGITSLFTTYEGPVITLQDSDTIIQKDNTTFLPGIGVDGQIVYTPGHTTDSISVITQEKAFVGDAAMNSFNFCRIHYRPVIIHDIDEVIASWDILTEKAQKIYPAHGNPFDADKLVKAKKKFMP
jgi:glyoxylase-like metal-dependent hydrolase (beta-lactamase superfamily II)